MSKIRIPDYHKDKRIELLKKAGLLNPELVYSTDNQSPYETKKKFDIKNKEELEKNIAEKKQKEFSEHFKGARGEVWKKQ